MHRWIIKVTLLLVFSFVMTSCIPTVPESTITKPIFPTLISPQNTLSPLQIPASTVIPTKTPEQTISPTKASTETPTLTPIPNWAKLPSLVEAVLKPADLSPDESITFSRILRHDVRVTDATDEMSNECLQDCAKAIWDTFDNQITIFLMRAGSPEKAERTVLRLYDEIGPPNYDYKELFDPHLDNGWAMGTEGCYYLNEKCHYVVSSRYGYIVVLVFSNHYPGSDDATGEVHVSIEIASEQIKKLKSLGFPP